jgi:hypothetical protein
METEEIKNKVTKTVESKKFLHILYILGIIIAAGIIFHAGVSVGLRKASFGRAWGEHYFENFGMGKREGLLGEFSEHFSNPNGTVGKVIQVSLPTFVVEGSDNTEKVILVSDDTEIVKARMKAAATDLEPGSYVVVVGVPNMQGGIEAKLVRIMPAGMNSMMNSSNDPVPVQ